VTPVIDMFAEQQERRRKQKPLSAIVLEMLTLVYGAKLFTKRLKLIIIVLVSVHYRL